GNKHVYICDVIETFQRSFPEKKRLFEIMDGEEGPWRYFEPQVTQTDWDRWKGEKVNGGRDREVRFLQDFGSLLKTLSPRQVISLGRHRSSAETREALLFLFGQFDKEFRRFLDNSCGDVHSWWQHL